MPSSIDMIVDGIVDGKQCQKLKTVVPQTDLNMVGQSQFSQHSLASLLLWLNCARIDWCTGDPAVHDVGCAA